MYMLDEVRVENLRIPGDQYVKVLLKKSKLLRYRGKWAIIDMEACGFYRVDTISAKAGVLIIELVEH